MSFRLLIIITASVLLSAPLSASAQAQSPSCAATDTNLTGEFAAWSTKTDLAAATIRKGLPKAELILGKAVMAYLPSTADVRYLSQPEKPGGSVSHGGLFEFKIAEAGTYRIGLGSRAWIDVLKDGKAMESTAHGHGPDCSTIRKVVDFPLAPGRYVLQISANAEAKLGVMVTRRP